jgi:SpoVK/Ycf46/Vps4 family AAA+-type ATPase
MGLEVESAGDGAETIALFEKAKNMFLSETTKEADKEEVAIKDKAKEIVNTTPGLTQADREAIFREAQAIATRNRAELERVAMESIEQKRAAIKQATYDKYGKGTPIN